MTWIDLHTMPLLSRVQPLPAVYGTNNITNYTVEPLVRILACGLLPVHTPVIILYDSTIVYSQHLALLINTYMNRQRIRTMFPEIIQILA